MSEVLTARERELKDKLKHTEQELRQANAELEERSKLLYKTKVAIEQLQQELAASRKDEENIREEATRICEEQAAHVRDAEDHIRLLEDELAAEVQKSSDLQGRVQLLEDDADSARTDKHHHSSDPKLREKDRVIESLQDEISILQEQLGPLDRLLKEATSALSEQQEMASQFKIEKKEADHLLQELMAKNHRLQDDNQRLQKECIDMKNNSAVKEQEAASAMVTAELSKKEIAALERDWQKRLAQMESEWRQKLGDAAKKLEDATAASNQELIAGRKAAEQAAQELRQRVTDTEREWEKRLQDGMRECERKFAAERKDSEKKFAEMEKQWLARVQENEQLWSSQLTDENAVWEQERSELEASALKQREDLDREYSRHVQELRASAATHAAELEAKASNEKALLEKVWTKKLEDVERMWRKRLEQSGTESSHRVEAMHLQVQQDKEAWLAADAENERKWQRKVEEARKRSQDQEAERELLWAEKFEAAHQRALQEREELEAQWGQRFTELQSAAQERYSALRSDLEAKVQSITERLTEMARRESRREKKRAELSRQVEELSAINEEEFKKRCDLERSLREAAGIFKRELYEKEEALAAANSELRSAREWQERLLTIPQQHDSYQMHPPGYLIRTSASSPSPGFQHPAAQHSVQPAGPPAAPSSTCRSSQYSPGPHPPQPLQHSPAPASVERELRALRLAREEYQHALLEQERIRNKLLSSIERKLEEREVLTSSGRASSPSAGRAKYSGASQARQQAQRSEHPSSGKQRQGHRTSTSPCRCSPPREASPAPPSSASDAGSGINRSLDFDTWHSQLTQQLRSASKNLEPSFVASRW